MSGKPQHDASAFHKHPKLVNVKEFQRLGIEAQEDASALFKQPFMQQILENPIDISTDDVRAYTPKQAISLFLENTIKDASEKYPEYNPDLAQDSNSKERMRKIREEVLRTTNFPSEDQLRGDRRKSNLHAMKHKRSFEDTKRTMTLANLRDTSQVRGETSNAVIPSSPNELLFIVSVWSQDAKRLNRRVAVYHFLGSNNLTELCDLFPCPQKVEFPAILSSSLIIEDVFYDDLREHRIENEIIDTHRLSTDIITWNLLQHGSHQYTNDSMENYTFADLSVIIGRKYRFLHLGDCEHFFSFDEISFMPDESSHSRYPVTVWKTREQPKFCAICEQLLAVKIVYNCSICPENPSFLCEAHAEEFLYDEEGNLHDSFTRIYDYIQTDRSF